MSANTATHGRSLTRTATVTPLFERFKVRSRPITRGGQRNPGTSKPRSLASRPRVRAAVAKLTVVDFMGSNTLPDGYGTDNFWIFTLLTHPRPKVCM